MRARSARLANGSGVTIIDVPVDYSRNAELFAHLHDGVVD